jgi:cation diffusion facilitator CzcD-associated flavoprotein CzcO
MTSDMDQSMNGGSKELVDDSRSTLDVVIVGGGITGIDAAYRFQTELPGCKYTVLEARGAIGGTWDFFRYPGIRSDSDLFTFGFPWRPWTEKKSIAEGELIVNYIREAAKAEGIDHHVRFHHRLIAADWSTKAQTWTLTVEANGEIISMYSRFLMMGCGYFDYEKPLPVVIPGLADFQGEVVHPQFWPQDLDYTDKEILIIGSGATAITLLPNLAKKAARVTMIQRSPSYLMNLPNPKSGGLLYRYLPESLAFKLTRLYFLIFPVLFFQYCQMFPNAATRMFRNATIKELPENYPYDPHFKPTYKPWDQRVCFTPDGDFFEAIRKGKADVATGVIQSVTKDGILLESGQKINADMIVTATGIKIKIGGGVRLSINRQPIDISEKYMWKNTLLQDVPNCAFVIGYTTMSWTLGADATNRLFCRLVRTMLRDGFTSVVPRLEDAKSLQSVPIFHLRSTYVQKGLCNMPKTGDSGPWKRRKNYMVDVYEANYGNLKNGLEYH